MWCGGVLGLDALSHVKFVACGVELVVALVQAAPILVVADLRASGCLGD